MRSGALKIGEAGEFDYSGSQALKALKEEEGIENDLINPNIATDVRRSEVITHSFRYLQRKRFVKENRKALACVAFGGQTALNCEWHCTKEGILEKI